MKKLISTGLLAVIFTVGLSINLYAEDKSMKEQVVKLAESGEICKVYGHRWHDTTLNIVLTSYPPQYPAKTRKCNLCNKEQVEETTPSKWIDR